MFPLRDDLPHNRLPLVTILLIAANIVVFVLMLTWSEEPGSSSSPAIAGLSSYDEHVLELGAIPARITDPGAECGVSEPAGTDSVVCGAEPAQSAGVVTLEGPPWWVTILTSMFLAGGILHLAGNMLFLWIFGNRVEESMGRLRFALFYVLAGIAAVYSQALLDPGATQPVIGASGAVAGVLGAYIVMHPRARVLTFVFLIFFVTLIEIPAAALIAAWFLFQFIPVVGQLAVPELGTAAPIAYFAHVGGFVFGMLAVQLLRRRESPAVPEPV